MSFISLEFDARTRKMTANSEVKQRQRYLDKMTKEGEGLKSLVEVCQDNDPTVRPAIKTVCRRIQANKYRQLQPHPLLPALASSSYYIKWTQLTDLPFPLYYAHAAVQNLDKVQLSVWNIRCLSLTSL